MGKHTEGNLTVDDLAWRYPQSHDEVSDVLKLCGGNPDAAEWVLQLTSRTGILKMTPYEWRLLSSAAVDAVSPREKIDNSRGAWVVSQGVIDFHDPSSGDGHGQMDGSIEVCTEPTDDVDGDLICTCSSWDMARLIAAAPETLAERDRLKEANDELLDFIENIQHFRCIKFKDYECGQHGLLDKYRPEWRTAKANSDGEDRA